MGRGRILEGGRSPLERVTARMPSRVAKRATGPRLVTTTAKAARLGHAVLRCSGNKSTAGATLREARRAIATLGRRPFIDHDNLEAFADPVDYDRRDSSDTGVAFYASLARETGGPVLELACGTGLVAIPIARQGFAVTGLDVVPGMLERARSKSADLPARWV